jgi:hypothetical protein
VLKINLAKLNFIQYLFLISTIEGRLTGQHDIHDDTAASNIAWAVIIAI